MSIGTSASPCPFNETISIKLSNLDLVGSFWWKHLKANAKSNYRSSTARASNSNRARVDRAPKRTPQKKRSWRNCSVDVAREGARAQHLSSVSVLPMLSLR